MRLKLVQGGDNLADALTNHSAPEDLHRHLKRTSGDRPSGRHSLAPETESKGMSSKGDHVQVWDTTLAGVRWMRIINDLPGISTEVNGIFVAYVV